MMSLDIRDKTIILPKMVLMYFAYQSNLDYEHSAFLYAYLLKHQKDYEELYEHYEPRMERFVIDSAATSTEELGNPVYPPARRELAAHGVFCGPHTARQMTRADYDKYDLLIGMDSANIRNMTRICGGDPAGYPLHAVWRDGKLLDCADPKALADHLSALSLARLTGNYNYGQQDRTTYILYFDPPRTDMGSLCVLLSGSQCKVSHSNSALSRPYYLPEGVDIEQLDSLLTS